VKAWLVGSFCENADPEILTGCSENSIQSTIWRMKKRARPKSFVHFQRPARIMDTKDEVEHPVPGAEKWT
jgi:hypothetical protein